jgi:hypothetical protein
VKHSLIRTTPLLFRICAIAGCTAVHRRAGICESISYRRIALFSTPIIGAGANRGEARSVEAERLSERPRCAPISADVGAARRVQGGVCWRTPPWSGPGQMPRNNNPGRIIIGQILPGRASIFFICNRKYGTLSRLHILGLPQAQTPAHFLSGKRKWAKSASPAPPPCRSAQGRPCKPLRFNKVSFP